MSSLLVSVRNAAEAEEALAGGAAIIDVKEPSRGSLGRPDPAVVFDVLRTARKRAWTSVALGELIDNDADPRQWSNGADLCAPIVKAGLSGFRRRDDWRKKLLAFERAVFATGQTKPVAVAYADWERADSPPPYDVLEFVIGQQVGTFFALLIDTWEKDGSNLLDWLPLGEVMAICQRARAEQVWIALAGSLSRSQIIELLPAEPVLFAVRGAACDGGRQGKVSRNRVAELATLLSSAPC
jgi:(5-formylfuran-3-yl)methyl phosphate synthase